ncbi:ATP-binding protein [Azospirillum sp. TSO22-1]|uniref:hybrid sensor histidine kinase/response regulator n=1 Tax=Azospirillum sp. TSO22-1 TaxID=716789 RepID=UPI000D652A5C|nr:ATP-binding protein [Azospirillum sp. TSO22-1]
MSQRHAKPLKLHLVLLVLGALLPLIVLGGWFIVRDAETRRLDTRQRLIETTRALTLAMDKQVEASFATLRTLAHLRSLVEGDFGRFGDTVNAVLRERPEWSSVLLLDGSGVPVLTVAPSPDAALARGIDAEVVQRVMRTGEPAVSNLLHGDVVRRPLVTAAAPVFVQGAVRYVLAAGIAPERLGEILLQQRVPERWEGAIIDGAGTIVARARNLEESIGKPAARWFVDGSRGQVEGTLTGDGIDGGRVEVAFRRSALGPWTLTFGAPADVLDAGLLRTLSYGLASSAAVLLLSVGFALVLGQRIVQPMLALGRAADAMNRAGDGDAAMPEAPASPVEEVNAAVDAMRRAALRLADVAAERERRLRDDAERTEQDFRLAITVGRLIAFRLDAGFRYTWVSAGPMGLNAAEMLGRRSEELFEPATAAALNGLYQRVWDNGRGGRVDVPVRVPGRAHERHVDLAVEPVRGTTGAVEGLTGVAYDVTEHVRAQRAAERANDAKTRFLAAASHDLRQPIQALRLLLYLLTEKAAPDPSLVRVTGRMGEALDSTERMLGRLMEFAALESGKVTVAGQAFRLDELVARIAAEATPEAERKGLTLRARTFPCATVSDPVLLERIVRNLVSNALRYTPSGGILVGLRRAGRTVRVVVYDTGCGVPEAMRGVIFEEFRQLSNPERDRAKGMGLGLAIVARTAELLGHRLGLRSRENHGSAFSVEVPCLPPSTVQVQPSFDLPAPAVEGASLLLVEDDPMQAMALSSILEGAGFRVLAANDWRSAEWALKRGQPDLIVSDFRLPDGASGLDIIRTARTRYDRFIPAILVTGDTQAAIAEEAALEACAIFHKPYTPQALVEAINRRLAEARRAGAEAVEA